MLPEGVLFKGAGPAVFLMENKQKRPFVDGASFYHYKFKWKHVMHISDKTVQKIPTGRVISRLAPFRLNSPSQLLVSGSRQRGVYLLDEDVLYGFQTQAVFERLNYTFEEVVTIPDAIIHFLPKGKEIVSPFCAKGLINGLLFQGPDLNLYYSEHGKLRVVHSEREVRFFKWDPNAAIVLSIAEWQQALRGPLLKL